MMAKFEVGQRVRIKPNIDSHWGGMVAVVSSFYRGAAIVTVDNGSTLMYEVNDLEPTKSAIFHPGDIVRAEKGDEIIQGKVYGSEISTTLGDTSMDDLESDGYTLTLVKRPEPEIILPTKFNALVLVDGRTWIRASNDMWFWAFGDWSGIESEKLAAKAKRFDDYRVIFEGENE